MGRPQLYNTDEERIAARRAYQKKYNKNRNSPETLLRQSMKESRQRIDAGSKDNHHQLMAIQAAPTSGTMINDTNTNRTDTPRRANQNTGTDHSKKLVDNKSSKECTSPIYVKSKSTKSQRQRYSNVYYRKILLLNKYKEVFGVEIVEFLKQHDQLQLMNINGKIVPHLTHTARRMLTAYVIVAKSVAQFQLALNSGLLDNDKQNITDKDSTLQTESADTKSNTTTPATKLNQSPIPVPSVCTSSNNIESAYDQDTDDEDDTQLDSKPDPIPSSCISGNLDSGYDLDTDNEDMDDEEEGPDHNKYKYKTEEHPIKKEEDTDDE